MKVGDRVLYDDTSMNATAGVDCFEGIVEAEDGETVLVRRVKIVSETSFMKAEVVRVMKTSDYVTVIESPPGFDAKAHRDFLRGL